MDALIVTEFVPILPKAGQLFVSMKRRQLFGVVTSVTADRRVRYRCANSGRVHQTSTNWELLQEEAAEYRFVDELPEGFTTDGNGWAPWSGPCADCGRPADVLADGVKLCAGCLSIRKIKSLRELLERAEAPRRRPRRRRR